MSSLLANGTRLLAVGCLGMVATAASLPSKAVGEAPRCVETAGLASVEGEKAVLDLAPTPAPEESDLPEIYLVPECHYCLSVAEIDLASGVFSLSRKPLQVVSSQLILMDSQGKVLLYIENPYGFDGTAAVGRSLSIEPLLDIHGNALPNTFMAKSGKRLWWDGTRSSINLEIACRIASKSR